MVLRMLCVVEFFSELQECLLAAFVVMLIFIRKATSLEASSKELAIMKNA